MFPLRLEANSKPLTLPRDAHARCVGKFVENNFEKLDRLVELHEKYHKQASAAVARVPSLC